RADTSSVTVAIENDVIDTLKEMIEALKKAIKENREEPPPPNRGPQPPDRKKPLVDLVQELKMVLGMQKRVHERTRLYGRMYPGEQVPPERDARSAAERARLAEVRKEMTDLSGRQERIGKVTRALSVKVRTGERPID